MRSRGEIPRKVSYKTEFIVNNVMTLDIILSCLLKPGQQFLEL